MSQAGFLGTGINPNLFVQVIDGNVGSATPVAGVVNIVGSGNIFTTGAGNTLTITVVGTTNHAVQVGNASGSLTSIPVGTTGQVLTGVTGADPVFAAPATSGTVTSISQGQGITLTPNPIISTGTVALTIPVAIANGGTNAVSFSTTDGVVIYDGTRLVTLAATGGAGDILTSQGAGLPPIFSPGAGSTITISTDAGGPTTSGSFTLTGGTTGLTTSATGTTISLTGDLVVGSGGTGRAALTNHSVLVGAGAAAVTQIAVGTTGQVLTGVTGADPVFAAPATSGTVTSITAGTGITLTPSPITSTGSVALTVPVAIANGGTNATSMTTTDGVVYYDGTRLVTTTVGTAGQFLTSNGAGVAPTFQTAGGATITITGDSGGALTSGSFTFTGGTTGLTFAGAGTTETLTGTLVVANGGTGRATLTNHGVLVGAGTSAITQLAVGTTGQVLTGVTGADPVFASPAASSISITGNSGGALTGAAFTFTGGTTGLTFAGAGSTETLGGTLAIANGGTNATSMANTDGVVYYDGTRLVTTAVGTATQVLTSNGAGVAPTFQPASGGTSFTWSVITANQTAAINNGYICNKAGTLALALPSSAAIGSIIEVTGINTALGWQITQASGQQIFFGTTQTTSGASGTLTSSATRDAIRIVCVVTDTTWQVLSSLGNISVV